MKLESKVLDEYKLALETGVFPSRADFVLRGFSDVYSWAMPDMMEQFHVRSEFLKQFGFAVLCSEAVDALRPYSPWLEIGAGSGSWTKGLKSAGLDIIGSDSYAGVKWQFKYGAHAPLMVADAVSAIKMHPERNVLSVWPTYMETWAAEALNVLAVDRIFALVHEGEGGCVGEEELYQTLWKTCEEMAGVDIPQFPNVHDRLTLYRKVRV